MLGLDSRCGHWFGLVFRVDPHGRYRLVGGRCRRTAADLGAGRYFFDSVYTPAVFWVDLDKLDLKPGSPSLKLDLQSDPRHLGEGSGAFKPAEPFRFLAPKD